MRLPGASEVLSEVSPSCVYLVKAGVFVMNRESLKFLRVLPRVLGSLLLALRVRSSYLSTGED